MMKDIKDLNTKKDLNTDLAKKFIQVFPKQQ